MVAWAEIGFTKVAGTVTGDTKVDQEKRTFEGWGQVIIFLLLALTLLVFSVTLKKYIYEIFLI